MPLPKFKTLEEVPEAVREGYVERDGEWVPDVEDVTGLKQNRDEVRNNLEKAKQRLRDLERELTDAKKKAGGLTDEEIAARRAEIDAEVKPVREQLEAAQKELRTLKFDDRLKALIGSSGAVSKRVDALHRLIGDRFDLSENGTLILKDKPHGDIAKYLSEDIAKEYPEFFESKQKGGADFLGSQKTDGVTEDQMQLLTSNPMALLAAANEAK